MNLFGLGNKNHFDVNGKTVLLTGGSDGMGKNVAKILAGKGASIVIVARHVGRLGSALQEIKACATGAGNQRFHSISADVSKPDAAAHIVSQVVAWNNGPPDIVWCLAGSARPTLFLDASPSEQRQQMDVNYWSCADMAHAILSHWLAPSTTTSTSTPHHLIFTSSIVAFYPITGYGAYAPTKAAIRSLSDSLAQEVKLYTLSNVKIHTVFPGTILTAGLEEENKTKPEITKLLEESDPKETPEKVAERSVQGLEKGEYLVTTGWMGDVLRACAWGGSERNNWVIDGLVMGIVNLAWLFVKRDLDGKVVHYGKAHGHPSTYLTGKSAK